MKRSPVLRTFSFFPVHFLVLFLFVACSKHVANSSGSTGLFGPLDIYVAGILIKGASLATYWKNGSLKKLSDSLNGGELRDIIVNGSDIYAAGYQWSASRIGEINYHPVYWKNGALTNLGDSAFGPAYSIAVYGSDVYTSESEYGLAAYRKNNQRVLLDSFNSGVGFLFICRKSKGSRNSTQPAK